MEEAAYSSYWVPRRRHPSDSCNHAAGANVCLDADASVDGSGDGSADGRRADESVFGSHATRYGGRADPSSWPSDLAAS